jgi:hypothetical protein
MNGKNENITTPGAYTDEVIGSVTFTERSEEISERHTYYAADYRTYHVLPGTYEARLTRRGDAATQANVIVTVDIEVTREVLHDGIGGVNYKTHTDDTVRQTTKTYSVYDYQAAAAAGEREPALVGGEFRLAPEWVVVTRHTVLPALANSPERHYTSRDFAKIG